MIDLSYAAAVKLGYRNKGSARVRVEALQPDDDASGATAPVSYTHLDVYKRQGLPSDFYPASPH